MSPLLLNIFHLHHLKIILYPLKKKVIMESEIGGFQAEELSEEFMFCKAGNLQGLTLDITNS